ncbi:MAG: alpha/beta hydrolase, partial [Actinobacteria bacterium]|nr:alpha/beta hydrolase [Actinomycetota bacterium]
MSTVRIDGIETRYEVVGDGPPLLMFSPGGFNSSLENWSSMGVYGRLKLLDRLPSHYTCVLFDRRESGRSGGRLERLTWDHYVTQGMGLLDHLDIGTAHLMGGCVGCSAVLACGVARPERVSSMVLFWPAGGAHYRRKQHARIEQHLAFVAAEGLGAVVELARAGDAGFSEDPRVGPWVTVIRSDDRFAAAYAGTDVVRYDTLLSGMSRVMFDRDTVPGAEPEDLMVLDVPALVIPGR